MSRYPKLLAVLLIVTLFLVACGGNASPTPAPAEPTSAPEVEEEMVEEEMVEEAPEVVENLECSDAIGCVEVAAGDPIRLASALVVTGPNESLGLDSQYGVEIAIADRGEIMGHAIELQPEDDGCSAEGGQTAGQKVVSDPTIAGVIGTSCSGAGVPMSQIVCDAGIVMVSPSNTAPVLTEEGSRGACYFRTAHNDKIQGKAMADFVFNELGITKAAAIHDGDPYTEGLASVFRDSFTENGGEIVAFEAEASDATNVEPLLTSVAAAGPELIYYPVFIPLGSLLTKTAQEIDGLEGVVLAAADGVLSPDFIDASGDAAEGMYMSGPDLGFGNSIYDTFLATYQSEYGTEPTAPFHAHAYDATNMVLDAIAAVAQQDADGNMLIGRQALIDAVGATSGMNGITGTLTCDAQGDCADARIAVNQVQGGEFVPVAGAADTMGDDMMGGAAFVATQFGPVEEAEKFRAILAEGGLDFTTSEGGPLLDQILAGSGEIDVVGMLHGDFPPLKSGDALMNMVDVLDDISGDREIAQAFIDTGLLGSDDFLAYVPWMQATYIMAAHADALQYLPAGADVNAITWEEFAGWCQNILDETGSQGCGLPHAGLFHRFLEGYMFPSFTGGMVSDFRSEEAHDMMAWARDVLWPTIHPESINYDFMQEPLQSGDVMVAFDHTARLIDAFNSDPDSFIAFPAPAGPAGRGFMPVIVGLGIPADAPHPEAGAEVIEFLTRPDVQGAVLEQLGFFPVVEGVDTSNLPAGVEIEAGAVNAQATAPDALPALLPTGLGDRGGEINQIFRNAFDRIVLEGEEIDSVLNEEGDNLQALMNETGAPCWAPDPAGDGPCQVNENGASAGVGAMMMDDAMMGDGAVFVATQFGPVEEAEKFRAILEEGGYDFTTSEGGPLLDQIIAGSGSIDVVGMLHGDFPPLAREGALTNMIDVAEDLLDDRDLAEAFIDTGLLGTDDFLAYVPWMQATYIMAASTEALDYLPAGADVNALSWDEFAGWCQNILDETGSQGCGLPHAGLFHRFLEGYMFPSHTGGMVSNFRSQEAMDMMAWARDVLWPTIHPESINYDFMQEPLQSGDVMVAFDHTARLIDAFNSDPDGFVAFPAPAGAAGRGFMPVIVGLGMPADAPHPEAGADLIEFLTRPDVQGAVLKDLGFFPVVGGVDTSALSDGVAIEAAAVNAQATAPDALPALLPVGLGDRGGEINQIFRNAFDRIVLDGEDIADVMDSEGDNLQALMNETGAPCWAPDPLGDGPCQVNEAGFEAGFGMMDSGDMMEAGEDIGFIATQFGPVEEAEKFRAILSTGGYDFTTSEGGPLLDQVIAGTGAINVVGMLHGDFPPLAREGSLTNMIDVAEDLLDSRDLADAFIDTGLLGTDDFLHYVPWMQATYIMGANVEALDYLPAGADIDALTWVEFGEWCQNLNDETGSPKCGLPHAGLFHRFLEGYLFPSFTGGMVSNFRSDDAVGMMEWARDVLWPNIHPESINYDFMQEPMQSGDVWVAFDHTARLIDAFNSDPEGFIAFPAPAGAYGSGFMPVIVGLGIPADAPDPAAGEALIDFLTLPETQGAVLENLGFFPVTGGVDTSNLPAGVELEARAVGLQANSATALPALLPVGLGDRGGEINQIFRNAFDRIVLEGEEIETVLQEEGDNLQALMNETGAPCWAPDPAGDGPCVVNP